MSWHYLQEQAGACWEQACLAGAPSALSSLIPTASKCCFPGKETERCPGFQFGTTSEPLTALPGEAGSTLLPGGFPAKTFPSPEKAPVSTEKRAGCGFTWPASLGKFCPDTFTWKTRQCLLTGGLAEFSGTWPYWGSMRSGEYTALPKPAPLTCVEDSGLWPTPVADGDRTKNYRQGGRSLGAAVRKFATPVAADARGAGINQHSQTLGRQMKRLHGGGLNPPWTEWLMGWPIGWTDLKPLETGKFQKWQDAHFLRYNQGGTEIDPA